VTGKILEFPIQAYAILLCPVPHPRTNILLMALSSSPLQA